jgi:hypothetical protein
MKMFCVIENNENNLDKVKASLFATKKQAESFMLQSFYSEVVELCGEDSHESDQVEKLLKLAMTTNEAVLKDEDFFEADPIENMEVYDSFASIWTGDDCGYVRWNIQEVEVPTFSTEAKSLIRSLFYELQEGAEDWYISEVMSRLLTEEEAKELGLEEYYPKED